MTAEDVVNSLLENAPPRYFPGTNDEERQAACRSAFTAYEYAISVDRGFHADTWKAVQGSPYEREYRRRLMK